MSETPKLIFEHSGHWITLNNKEQFAFWCLEELVEFDLSENLYHMVVVGNDSPLSDGDPRYNIEQEQRLYTASQWMDLSEDNFQFACNYYYNKIISKPHE